MCFFVQAFWGTTCCCQCVGKYQPRPQPISLQMSDDLQQIWSCIWMNTRADTKYRKMIKLKPACECTSQSCSEDIHTSMPALASFAKWEITPTPWQRWIHFIVSISVESNFVVAIVVSDGSFYHWSPSLQTYQPILYQSPDSSTEFGTNLYSWLDCKEISALLSPDEKSLILVCFCMPKNAPCRCPSWRFPCPLESKYETRVAAVEQSGPCRRHRSRGWPKESETPGLVWDHPNFQKFWEAKASNWKLWLHRGSSNFTFRRRFFSILYLVHTYGQTFRPR